MAKCSTLARNIDKNFLECGICFNRFRDPRGLPCLHAFCCKCLIDWAKNCSEGRRIVICPLCKKVFPIPDDGIKGFPVHFLVTNLREAVDTDKQAKSSNKHKYCTQHVGEVKRFFCETCCTAICPDCCALDPRHQGHRFTRLEDARNKQAVALQDFIDNFDELRKKYNDAILQTWSVENELQQSIQTVNEDLDQLKEHYITRLEATFEKQRDEVNKVWMERSEELCDIKSSLEKSMATLQTAYERGRDVIRDVITDGSEYEIISAYTFMSAASRDATEPVPADATLGYIGFEADRFEITSVGHLTCENQSHDDTDNLIDLELDSNYSTTSPTPPVLPSENVPTNQKPVASPIDPENHGQSTVQHAKDQDDGTRSRGAYNMDHPPDLDISRQSSYKGMTGLRRWKPAGHFKTSPAAERPKGIAIHANGDIAVTSRRSPMTVYSKGGDVKCIQKGSLCNANDIAISSENQYIVTGNNEIKVYLSKWFGTRRLFSFPTFDFKNQLSSPSAVGVDSCGRIIVGMHDGKTVSIHQPDGDVISMFETSEYPRRLAVLPNNELVITFDDNTIQVISQAGHKTKTIQPPSGVEWVPWYICCSKQGQVIVCNQGNPKGVFMYIFRDGEYRITDCLLKLDNNGIPFGITLSRDERELFVVDRGNNLVKKYHAQ